MIDKYDSYFKKYSEMFFGPLFDWRWFKAQTKAESAFNPEAQSSAGAMGLMQLMPDTMVEVAEHLGLDDNHWDPEINIHCGIYYDRKCWEVWKKEKDIERIRFMLASYNAGTGNILKAQRLTTFKDKWASVSAQLYKITGWDDAPQTLSYVRRIEQYHAELLEIQAKR